MDSHAAILRILDFARWAPSGDNTQPWRFQILGPDRVVVHGFDTRTHCVYDLDGHPSQISLGALLETIRIAASTEGMSVEITRDLGAPETQPRFDLRFQQAPGMVQDPLANSIKKRAVQRRSFTTRPLREDQRQALSEAVGPSHSLRLIEGLPGRLRTAKLMFHSAKIRLTIEEAYKVHRDVIEWNARFSKTRIPDQALGAGKATLVMMRHVMKSWARVQFFNRFLAGTWAPRVELDLIPGIRCAAHFVICANTAPTSLDDYVAGGRAVQRLWLTATQLGLQLQPEVTPLVFARYARNTVEFSSSPGASARAKHIAELLADLVGRDVAERAVFMGRIGKGQTPTARSLRMDLNELDHAT